MKEISFLLILGMKFEELMNYYRFLYEKAKHRISSKACLKSINLEKKNYFSSDEESTDDDDGETSGGAERNEEAAVVDLLNRPGENESV